MSRKRTSKRSGRAEFLPVLKPNAAGVDIGATEIYVAVPADALAGDAPADAVQAIVRVLTPAPQLTKTPWHS